MKENQLTIRQFLKNYDEGKYESPDVQTQIEAGWFDWFCKDERLAEKTKKLVERLKQIVHSRKIRQDKMYVFFKNNCPLYGKLYDDFRICDMKTGDVIFCITPFNGHDNMFGVSDVWGRRNYFEEPLVQGSWDTIVKFFNTPYDKKRKTKKRN